MRLNAQCAANITSEASSVLFGRNPPLPPKVYSKELIELLFHMHYIEVVRKEEPGRVTRLIDDIYF